jgi:hypothetical protein
MAGYSGTPLPKKLGLQNRKNIYFAQAPASVLRELGFRKPPRRSNTASLDFALAFSKSEDELRKIFAELKPQLASDGLLWIAWPKKSSGVMTDLNENIVRQIGLAAGLVDVKVCAIDETWSGLKFVFRLKDRKKT